MTAGFNNILIIGVGLIGGSLAAALKKLDPELRIYGTGSGAETLRLAKEHGLIEKDEPPAYQDIDLVVLASPIETFEEWFRKLADENYEGVVTDVASAKTAVVEIAARTLKYPCNFIPGHPMAGSEKSGVLASKDNLFEGATWVITRDDETDMHAFLKMHALLTAIGAFVVSVDASEHDRLIAAISHVPHVAASSLVMLADAHKGGSEDPFQLVGGGFRDTTRIAAGDPALWAGILCNNADMVAEALEEYRAILGRFVDAVKCRDNAALEQMLANPAVARKAIADKRKD